MTDQTFSDLLVARLLTMGIRAVFGVPGGAIEPLYDALSRASRVGSLRLVTARHESGAAYMANGWWRETGRPCAVVTTTGPGATNAIAGAACANMDGIPMLLLTAQVASFKRGRQALQESSDASRVDTVAMFGACTRFSSAVTHPAQLDALLAIAYARMHEDTPGPAHLSIPTDVLRMPAGDLPPWSVFPLERDASRADIHGTESQNAATVEDVLRRSVRPVILLGDHSRDAVPAAFALAERIGASVCGCPAVSDLITPRHPLFHGYFGFAGHATATVAVRSSDCVLLVDSSCGELEAATWGGHAGRIVHLSDSPERLARSFAARRNLLGNPAATLRELHALTAPRAAYAPQSAWLPSPVAEREGAGVPPQTLMRLLAEQLPDGTAIYADAGNAFAWAIHYLHGSHPGGPMRMSLHYASMGWTVGASVGAALAAARPVVALIGDGALLMAGQEFSTAVQERVALAFIVLNDAALGMVRHGQRMGGAESVAWELPPTDFAAIAVAMGGHGVRVGTVAALAALDIPSILRRNRPTLIDVQIDRDQVPPIADRVQALGASGGRS